MPDDHDAAARLQRAVDDGALIAESAMRIAVTNAAVRAAMTGERRTSVSELLPVARRTAIELAEERLAEAERLRRRATDAASRRGLAEHAGDYRTADVPALTLLADINTGIAAHLSALAADDETLGSHARRALAQALGDIVEVRLPAAPPPPGVGPPPPTAWHRYLAVRAVRRDIRRLTGRRRLTTTFAALRRLLRRG